MFSEPPRSPYDLHFHLLGVPVRVHWMFWLVAPFLGLGANSKPEEMVLWIGAVFVSILVHEMGHALAARSYGWQPWITLHGFGGLASYQPTYHNPIAQIIITFCGPGIGFAFAALLAALIAASHHRVIFDRSFDFGIPVLWEPYDSVRLNGLIFDLFYINIYWGLVNLLPIYPLDGGQIVREVLGLMRVPNALRTSLMLSIAAAGGMAIFALKSHNTYLIMFFAYLAFINFQTLQAISGRPGGWGGLR